MSAATAFTEMQAIKRQVKAARTQLRRLLRQYPPARHGKDWNPKADLLIQLRHADTCFEEAVMMMEPNELHVDVRLTAVRP